MMENHIDKIPQLRELYNMWPPESSTKQQQSKQSLPTQTSNKSDRSRSKSRIFKYKHKDDNGFGQSNTATSASANTNQRMLTSNVGPVRTQDKIPFSVATQNKPYFSNSVSPNYINSPSNKTPAVNFIYQNNPFQQISSNQFVNKPVAFPVQTISQHTIPKPVITFSSNSISSNAPILAPVQSVKPKLPIVQVPPINPIKQMDNIRQMNPIRQISPPLYLRGSIIDAIKTQPLAVKTNLLQIHNDQVGSKINFYSPKLMSPAQVNQQKQQQLQQHQHQQQQQNKHKQQILRQPRQQVLPVLQPISFRPSRIQYAPIQVVPIPINIPIQNGARVYSPSEYAKIRAQYPALTPATQNITVQQPKVYGAMRPPTNNNNSNSNINNSSNNNNNTINNSNINNRTGEAFRKQFYSIVDLGRPQSNMVSGLSELTGAIRKNRNNRQSGITSPLNSDRQRESMFRNSKINVYSSPSKKQSNPRISDNENYNNSQFKPVSNYVSKQTTSVISKVGNKKTMKQIVEQSKMQSGYFPQNNSQSKAYNSRNQHFFPTNYLDTQQQSNNKVGRYFDTQGERVEYAPAPLKKLESIDTVVLQIEKKQVCADIKQKHNSNNHRTMKDSFNFTTRINKQQKQRDVMGFSIVPRMKNVTSQAVSQARSFSPPILAKAAPYNQTQLHDLSQQSYQSQNIVSPPKPQTKAVTPAVVVQPTPKQDWTTYLPYIFVILVLIVGFGAIGYRLINHYG